jgi:hypothetical protein
MYLFEAISFIIKTCLIIYTQMHWELRSVFIGFAIHKIINWNPESTTVSESGIQDVESGIQGVGSGIHASSGIRNPNTSWITSHGAKLSAVL